jgi:hypothetical protein
MIVLFSSLVHQLVLLPALLMTSVGISYANLDTNPQVDNLDATLGYFYNSISGCNLDADSGVI